MTATEKLQSKIIDLETSLGLLQHDFDQQNQMLLENTKQIQQMELTIKRLIDQIAGLQSTVSGGRLAEVEKPPHY